MEMTHESSPVEKFLKTHSEALAYLLKQPPEGYISDWILNNSPSRVESLLWFLMNTLHWDEAEPFGEYWKALYRTALNDETLKPSPVWGDV